MTESTEKKKKKTRRGGRRRRRKASEKPQLHQGHDIYLDANSYLVLSNAEITVGVDLGAEQPTDIPQIEVEIVRVTDDTPIKSVSVPPQFGEYLLYLILTHEELENRLGDLNEDYIEVQEKFGVRKATIWYYKQVISFVWPQICKLLRWGLFNWVEEWFRRQI